MRIPLKALCDVGVRWDEQARTFVSYAPALDIYSQGPTEDEALRAIESAIRLYIAALEHRGLTVSSGIGPEPPKEYAEILKESGFGAVHTKSIPLELTRQG